MYRSILVPLDGSAFSEHALPLALDIVRRAGASLCLAHVHEPLVPVYGGAELAADLTIDTQVRNHESAYLERVVKRLRGVADCPVRPLLLEGPTPDRLCAQAEEADLVVMTTHGRGPLSRLWLGSIADQLVRRCTHPLVLVRPQDGKPDLGHAPAFRSILVPLDGSPMAEQILEPAVALGSLMGASFSLVRVIKPATVTNYGDAVRSIDEFGQSLFRQVQEMHRQVAAEAEDYLQVVAEGLRCRSLAVRTRVVSCEQVANGILKEACDDGADLVALATHGRGGLARLVLGSVADKVLRGSTTPLLVHRPPAPRPTIESFDGVAERAAAPAGG